MHSEIHHYNEQQSEQYKEIGEKLATIIDTAFPSDESKIWHAHPVWFINGNPIVGYSKLKNGMRLLFWSGQSFDEPLLKNEGKFKAAEIRYTSVDQIHEEELQRWLEKARKIQWDYKNIVKRKGRLELLMGVFFFLVGCFLHAQGQAPIVSSGKIQRLEAFPSSYVTSRNIDIWLPEGYDPQNKYAVLYMHDGQMLFDSAITWNHQSWEVDEVAGRLIKNKSTPPFIVVGIWNGGATRHSDYFPQKPFDNLTQEQKDTVIAQLQRAGKTKELFQPQSNKYLQFLVKELKPYIDKNYSTLSDRKNTMIAGSSMGGLISLYAICEYPHVFGGAACLSTHWIGSFTTVNNPVPESFFSYMQQSLPSPKQHKIYFDYGDKTLDALYPPFQVKADSIMNMKKFDQNNWKTIFLQEMTTVKNHGVNDYISHWNFS